MSRSFSSLARPSRRAVLRGAGVALALPWLESLVRPASAAAAVAPKRFVAIFLPCGAPALWTPQAAGVGSAWQLSSVLEPLAPLKSKVNVLSGLHNATVFNANGSGSVEPSEGRLGGGTWLTSMDAAIVREKLNNIDANGMSADQVIAQHALFAGQTALPSLQVGLSSCTGFCDSYPCSHTRSISWSSESTPTYKVTDPVTLFNKLAGIPQDPGTDVKALRDSRQSVLDAVLESATSTRARLGRDDQTRLDEFLDSVRSVEKRLVTNVGELCGSVQTKPNFPTVDANSQYREDGNGYSKSAHADLINDLVALALRCDLTRVVSYMLDDERSEFSFNTLQRRVFTVSGSSPGVGTCGEWHGAGMHGDQNNYATIVHFMVGKVAAFCQKLDALGESNGQTTLDNTVVLMGSAIHGSDHSALDLPTLLVGSGGGTLKTDQHLALGKRPLRDLYFTLMNGVYGLGVTDFGMDRSGAAIATIPELLV